MKELAIIVLCIVVGTVVMIQCTRADCCRESGGVLLRGPSGWVCVRRATP